VHSLNEQRLVCAVLTASLGYHVFLLIFDNKIANNVTCEKLRTDLNLCKNKTKQEL